MVNSSQRIEKTDTQMYIGKTFCVKILLPDGELNPGLPRDRRGYSPLYYRGLVPYLSFQIV